MQPPDWIGFDPAGAVPRRVAYFNGGFLLQKRLRRILQLTGHQLALFRPGAEDEIAVWGHSPYAKRGERVADKTGAKLLRIEDAFLRSLHPGRSGEPPLGLVICRKGMHFDISQPSDLEDILNTHPLDDAALLNRARGSIARLQEAQLSKYAAFDPTAPLPDPGYVLLIDQTRGDASIRLGRANAHSFREMLLQAQEDHPGARIVIKTHPESRAGHRPGHFTSADESDYVTLYDGQASPQALLNGAIAVYTVTSQLGFEAILAGHRPKVFGQPFYAGWGLSDDISPLPRRRRQLTRSQLFAGTMMLYPVWYDPYRDQLCTLEQVIEALAAQSRAWAEDQHGWRASGMRLWKRQQINRFFGSARPVRFDKAPRADDTRRQMIWAREAEALSQPPKGLVRVEDGFLRSKGLGAALVPPLSLVLDDLGIYYDPGQPSRLEELIRQRSQLRPDQHLRADRLRRRLLEAGLSKYNLGGALPTRPDHTGLPALPEGHRILVPGQVEDDASIRLGAAEVRSNLALLQMARAQNPQATILYKPHPDVEAGLRPGRIAPDKVLEFADAVLEDSDPAALLPQVQEVWTMTSLLGFEALLRGVKVTCLGTPFYCGWGLTRDLGPVPARRGRLVSLDGLVHAALIDYPRYLDPVTATACPPEVIVDRLAAGTAAASAPLRLLSKLQGLLASQAHLWR